jgi:hypothetical protein
MFESPNSYSILLAIKLLPFFFNVNKISENQNLSTFQCAYVIHLIKVNLIINKANGD